MLLFSSESRNFSSEGNKHEICTTFGGHYFPTYCDSRPRDGEGRSPFSTGQLLLLHKYIKDFLSNLETKCDHILLVVVPLLYKIYLTRSMSLFMNPSRFTHFTVSREVIQCHLRAASFRFSLGVSRRETPFLIVHQHARLIPTTHKLCSKQESPGNRKRHTPVLEYPLKPGLG